jgi:hypothetical protein
MNSAMLNFTEISSTVHGIRENSIFDFKKFCSTNHKHFINWE